MKGPSERLKYDLRRLWECPICKRRERTAGSVTFRHCLCQMKQLDGKPVVMKLIEDGVQRIAPPVIIEHEPPVACAIAEIPLAPTETISEEVSIRPPAIEPPLTELPPEP
jgi:hypothetical protein